MPEIGSASTRPLLAHVVRGAGAGILIFTAMTLLALGRTPDVRALGAAPRQATCADATLDVSHCAEMPAP
jgi:hypothetical protein